MKSDKDNWTALPKTKKLPGWKMKLHKEDELLQVILNIVQDGICILNDQLDVLYANSAMESWYNTHNIEGRKCYEAFHGRTEPCENCMILYSIDSREPVTAIHTLENIKGKGWHRTYCVPVLDSKGEVKLIVEYIRDVTGETKSNLLLGLLEDRTQLLQDILEESKKEAKRNEQDLINKMNKAIDSVIRNLGDLLDNDTLNTVKKQLKMVIQGERLEQLQVFAEFTERELEIACYIRDGYISKEIAKKLNISKKTVDYHRMNIRKKLELDSSGSLKQFLIGNLKTIL